MLLLLSLDVAWGEPSGLLAFRGRWEKFLGYPAFPLPGEHVVVSDLDAFLSACDIITDPFGRNSGRCYRSRRVFPRVCHLLNKEYERNKKGYGFEPYPFAMISASIYEAQRMEGIFLPV